MKQLLKFVFLEACNHVKSYIENNGYRLLWNDSGKSKNEKAAQNVFNLAMILWCKQNDIDISPETDSGRGGVDFKFSRGSKIKAHLEVKLAKNRHLEHGIKIQLPIYMNTEQVDLGFILVIILEEKDVSKADIVKKIILNLNNTSDYDISPIIIDARKKPSASVAKSIV